MTSLHVICGLAPTLNQKSWQRLWRDTGKGLFRRIVLIVWLLCCTFQSRSFKYIKKSIKFERSGKYNFEVSGCENIWMDVKLNNNKTR